MEFKIVSTTRNWKKFNQAKKIKDFPPPEELEETAALDGNVLKTDSHCPNGIYIICRHFKLAKVVGIRHLKEQLWHKF